MNSSKNGECANGTREELAEDVPAREMRLMDYIPIYIPTVEQGLLDSTRREKRFLDFLKARPSKDWFLRFGFVGRLSPLSFLRRSGGPAETPPPPLPDRSPGGRLRRRFRVPFVRKINWPALIKYSKHWIRNPVNIAFLIWLVFVAAGLLMLFLVMTGILNQAIPSSSRRKKWTEIINQILNALFTIMCIYQHPKLFHHLVLLLRWRSLDPIELRGVYCKDGSRRVWERAHLAVVVALLHITCISQYLLCGLYWGYTISSRPDWAVNLCIGVGIAAPVIAGVYMVYGPLGKKQNEGQSEEEDTQDPPEHTATELRVYDKRVVVTSPQWIGGTFDFWDDRTVCCASLLCTFCVFGWNMERLGFGNMYVHIVTFILLVVAPFWVFNISALNVDDDTIRYIVGVTGIVLCLFGLLYGGFWRIQMRKRFKLPENPACCGSPAVTDCAHWLFCWSCSLAQEVRTANFYDVEEDSFCRKEEDSAGRQVLVPLPREGGTGPLPEVPGRSYSCPAKVGPANQEDCGELLEGDGGFARSSSMRSATVHAMRIPPPSMQMEED